MSAMYATDTLGVEVVLYGLVHETSLAARVSEFSVDTRFRGIPTTLDTPVIVDRTTWILETLTLFRGGAAVRVVQDASGLPVILAPVFPFPAGTSELRRVR